MIHLSRITPIALLLAASLATSGLAQANPNAESVAAAIQAKPFAQTRVALQISDGGAEKQTLVLNVAHNLLKFYGQDKIDLEIVAFGPGLRLLFKGNANSQRIQELAASGVRFSACENTIKAMSKKLGHPPELNPIARIVPAGIVRMVELNKAGFFVARP
jgi:intracellular sulfur oxidation DsrE/DsrF family protein